MHKRFRIILRQDIPSPPDYGLNLDISGEIIDPRSLVEITPGAGQFIPGLGIVIDF